MFSTSDALKSFAAMFNDLDSKHIEDYLNDDFCYSSQMVFDEIRGKTKYLGYIDAKLEAIKNSGLKVFAELAISGAGQEPNCLVMAQGDVENLVATVFIELKDGLINRADMCVVPSPFDVHRTHVYPKVEV
ncbi:MAG: hypothetical protein E6Q68_07340 [Polynucleobacter sp.]|nr:MAG: hypothetical protein E6Q68_07340 [Polynucleobacter sp.]